MICLGMSRGPTSRESSISPVGPVVAAHLTRIFFVRQSDINHRTNSVRNYSAIIETIRATRVGVAQSTRITDCAT